jgi:hypothetical protein
MSVSPQPSSVSPADNGDPAALSKGDDYGDKGAPLGQSHLLTDFEATDTMDSDERYLVRR